MNETTEMWKEHRQHKQGERWKDTAEGAYIVRRSGIPGEFRNCDTVFLVRHPNWPKCDFWPGSGHWMDHKTKKHFWGDAHSFVKWCLVYPQKKAK